MERTHTTTSRRLHAGLAATVCAVSVLILPMAPEARAYATEGCRWRSGGVTYQNHMTGGAVTPSANALANWTNATVITFIAQSNPDFSMNNGGYGATGWSGLTTYRCSGGYFLKGTLVQMNSYYTSAYTANKKQSVIAHELGHVIGLAHRSTSGCSGRSLMYPYDDGRYDSCGIYKVQPDDASGAAAIY